MHWTLGRSRHLLEVGTADDGIVKERTMKRMAMCNQHPVWIALPPSGEGPASGERSEDPGSRTTASYHCGSSFSSSEANWREIWPDCSD
jgi:hypothetical protein